MIPRADINTSHTRCCVGAPAATCFPLLPLSAAAKHPPGTPHGDAAPRCPSSSPARWDPRKHGAWHTHGTRHPLSPRDLPVPARLLLLAASPSQSSGERIPVPPGSTAGSTPSAAFPPSRPSCPAAELGESAAAALRRVGVLPARRWQPAHQGCDLSAAARPCPCPARTSPRWMGTLRARSQGEANRSQQIKQFVRRLAEATLQNSSAL